MGTSSVRPCMSAGNNGRRPRAIAPILPMPRYDLYARPWYRNVSPGASSVPASSDPTITVDAPAANALAISPEVRIPPSAITGTPALVASAAASMIADNCGTPTPATIRVVQIDPGPIPTLIASAPAATSAPPLRRGDVAGNIWNIIDDLLIRSTAAETALLWPCAVSITMQSQAASISACDRSNPRSPTVVAAQLAAAPARPWWRAAKRPIFRYPYRDQPDDMIALSTTELSIRR